VQHEPADVIAALRPLLGDERADTLDGTAARRLSGLVLVLENLHDPHNGGAATRTFEAVGGLELRVVGGIFFSERVTQGAEKWLEVHRDESIEACVAALKVRGFRLYATVPGAQTTLEEIDPLTPAAFLLGNEHEGLSRRARELADAEVSIPLHGFSQSVNLSVASALCVYTHARRRREALGRDTDLDDAALDRLRARYYYRDVRGADAVIARHLRRR
jgi:tRNA (guanosine-2'-O-)-methyltransferase